MTPPFQPWQTPPDKALLLTRNRPIPLKSVLLHTTVHFKSAAKLLSSFIFCFFNQYYSNKEYFAVLYFNLVKLGHNYCNYSNNLVESQEKQAHKTLCKLIYLFHNQRPPS